MPTVKNPVRSLVECVKRFKETKGNGCDVYNMADKLGLYRIYLKSFNKFALKKLVEKEKEDFLYDPRLVVLEAMDEFAESIRDPDE